MCSLLVKQDSHSWTFQHRLQCPVRIAITDKSTNATEGSTCNTKLVVIYIWTSTKMNSMVNNNKVTYGVSNCLVRLAYDILTQMLNAQPVYNGSHLL